MAIQEIRVKDKLKLSNAGKNLQKEIKDSLGIEIEDIEIATIYRFEGIGKRQAKKLRRLALTNPIIETSSINSSLFEKDFHILEIGYKPGVMNPLESSLFIIARNLGIHPKAVSESKEFGFKGNLSPVDIQKIGNYLVSQVEEVKIEKPKTLMIGSKTGLTEIVPLTMANISELGKLSEKRRLFLNTEEMREIQQYFQMLNREPTDIEIETLAQTWSEHCGHKTFKAKIITENGEEKLPLITRIKDTSKRYFKKVNVVSAFLDNAGGIMFYDGYVIIAKGETHNSPVAIEPYGGALTKNGGVYRDIAGFGQGGKNLVSLMINCFGELDARVENIPDGCLHPKNILLHNSKGERDYGNRMGIPTHNVSIHIHPDFTPKPTSLGVVFGIIPESRSQKNIPQAGDLIISVGGKTGRDGIHGATFSSGEMNEKTKIVDSTAVQIGNAIEEKRMFDALICCRDKDLIRAITDCGGGGYSSAIGEIGKDLGVAVNLDRVPQKYSGLAPWEIWLSESQERMIVAVDPKKWEEFNIICQQNNTPCEQIGKFTKDKMLTLYFNSLIVGQLSMDFLHDGLPQKKLTIEMTPFPENCTIPDYPTDWIDIYKKVLGHPNVSSFEEMLRQYDQTVQGTTALHPLTGVFQDVLNDGTIIAPLYGKPYGVVTAFGLNPILNKIDPYWGAIWAVTEAVSNFTAVGGNINEAALIDNFIWPYPDKETLSDLDKSVDALCDMMNLLEIPCVSGKDSLSSTYKGKNGQIIKIPPVLNISVFGKIPNIEKTVSLDIKKTESVLYLVGNLDLENLAGSVYFETQKNTYSNIPKVDIKTFPKVIRAIHQAIKSGKIKSCHDIGEGGLGTTIAEMCFGGDCGADIDLGILNTRRLDFAFFNETAGCFIVEVDSEKDADELFLDVPHFMIAKTKKDKNITLKSGKDIVFSADLEILKNEWKKYVKEVLA